MDPAAPEEGQRTPFASVLQQLRGGGSHGELSDALNELVRAVIATGKVGQLTFTVKVAPNGEEAVLMHDTIKVTIPQATKATTLFFADEAGTLTRKHPRQMEIGDGPLRDAAEATG